eukprot:scpid12531/ scgid33449/ Fermitin family homolog 1; Kindlin-1; Unc-112-related protein 1
MPPKSNREWELSVFTPQIGATKTFLVTSGMSIGEVVVKVASALGPQDWSDFALWWPERNIWLNRPRLALSSEGVQSDSKLHFLRINQVLQVQLPDRTVVKMPVNMVVRCFHAVEQVCKTVGIRRFEELSFMRCNNRPVEDNQALNYFGSRKNVHINALLDPLMVRDRHTPEHTVSRITDEGTYVVGGQNIGDVVRSDDVPDGILLDRWSPSSMDKAYLHGLWFDSSRPLFSQGVQENDFIQLRFKYFSFLDLDPLVDAVRISQLYEQARWSILTEDVDCTEEETYTFAALQFQVQLAAAMPREVDEPPSEDSDLDQALTNLQFSLGTQPQSAAAAAEPTQKIEGDLKFQKVGKLTLKSAKTYRFVFQDCSLVQYKKGEVTPMNRFNVRGADLQPDVEVDKDKYQLRVSLSDGDDEMDVKITFETTDEFCTWLAAFRMASRGKSAGSTGHREEVKACEMFLDIQRTGKSHKENGSLVGHFVPNRILKKKAINKIAAQVLGFHGSLERRSVLESKLAYIRAWEGLQDFGLSYFIIKFSTYKAKDELLGVAYNRLVRLDPQTHAHLQTWRYSTMRTWDINWEIKEMRVDHEDGTFSFTCSSSHLKILHEFIGGYIFMSMRKDVHEAVNAESFLKLTGGWEG